MKNVLLSLGLSWMLGMICPAEAITITPFGPNGEGGTKNGQTLTIGTGGTVFEVDGFLKMEGMDLNGPQFGVTAQLSRDSLPAGLGFIFTNYLSSDRSELVLSYTFTNAGSVILTNLNFFVLLDAEIDQTTNTFFNEFGSSIGNFAAHGYDANEWQIDEPDFLSGSLLKNIFLGSLNNSNGVPTDAINDVAMSFGFSLGNLSPGRDATVLIQISENGQKLGSFLLAQHDNDSASPDVITLSGVLPVTGSQMANPPHEMLVLQGKVVRDGNTNGAANPTDLGLSGVTVKLLSNSIPVMTSLTDFSGQYQFSVPPGLTPGAYTVTAVANGLTFVPVAPEVKANFASGNPSSVVLPLLIPVLNFDFRGDTIQQFENISGQVGFRLDQWKVNYASGGIQGTLTITNLPGSGAIFGPPWQLGLKASSDFSYVSPSGTLPNGVTNIDLSVAIRALLPDGVLNPGQVLVLTNAVEVYSRYRRAPTNTLFEIWATKQ